MLQWQERLLALVDALVHARCSRLSSPIEMS